MPRQLLARVIEPVSKLDTNRVLEEIGIVAPSYRTICRGCPVTPVMSGGSGSCGPARRTWG